MWAIAVISVVAVLAVVGAAIASLLVYRRRHGRAPDFVKSSNYSSSAVQVVMSQDGESRCIVDYRDPPSRPESVSDAGHTCRKLCTES